MLEFSTGSGHTLFVNHILSFLVSIGFMTYAMLLFGKAKKDKLLHTVISAAIVFILLHLFNILGWIEFWWLSIIIALVIGFSKELADRLNKKKQLFDWYDILADAIGACSVGLVYLFSFLMPEL